MDEFDEIITYILDREFDDHDWDIFDPIFYNFDDDVDDVE